VFLEMGDKMNAVNTYAKEKNCLLTQRKWDAKSTPRR
jgi:hypothetical protein